MDERAVRSVPWTLLTYAGNKLFSIVTIVVLARLLSPADFGVMAIAALAVNLLGYLSNFGLQSTLLLRPDLTLEAKGTLLSLMVGLSLIIAVALAGASPTVARLFDEPRLAGVLAAMAGTIAFGGPRWFYESLMQLELEFRPRFTAQIAASVITAVASISLAMVGAGVWSLAGGFILGGLVHTVVLFALAPYRVPLAFERRHATTALRDGRGFMAQGSLAFIQDNADYLAVSRILGSTQLGYYSMAYRLSELPYYGIADPVSKVTFPSFSKMRHLGQDITPAFLSTLRLVALVTVPLGVVLSAAAEPFTNVLYGDRWLPMIGALGVLGVWATIRPTHATLGWLLNSVGDAGLLGAISGLSLLLLVPAVVLAADQGGISAVAWVMLADVALTSIVLSVLVSKRAGVSVGSQFAALKPVLVAGPLGWLATRLTADVLAGQPSVVALGASSVVAFASFAVLASLIEPGIMGQAFAQMRRTVGHLPTSTSD